MSTSQAVSERRVVLLVAAVQFVNVLDFVMVMPLGPDFSEGLGISTAHIGILGGSYTAAAAVSGILCSFFLDRFDRRKALAWTLLGLVLGTALGGLAVGLKSLVAARLVAGAFGGPATSLAFAIVTDCVAEARRGSALGTVMTAFSLASVIGVPISLELSARFGWRSPFFALAGVGTLLCGAAIHLLPTMKRHLDQEQPLTHAPLIDPPALLALGSIALVMLGVFLVVPSLSPYVQHNLGYPREYLGVLYFVGGVASFFSMRVVGRLVDRFGASKLIWSGTAIHLTALTVGFFLPGLRIPILVFFVLYMVSGSVRMVPLQTLSTKVPTPARRARYMSTQSAVQHIFSSLGAMTAALLLSSKADGSLIHTERVAAVAFLSAALVPLLSSRLDSLIKRRPPEPS